MDTVIPCIQRASAVKDEFKELSIPDTEYDKNVAQLRTFSAADTSAETLDTVYSERVSDNPDFKVLLKRTLMDYAPEDARKGLAFILSALK